MYYKIFHKIMCTNTKSLQLGLALYAFLWGFWVVIHPNVFNFSLSYSVLNQYGGELFWGWLLVLISTAKILSIKVGKLIYKKIAMGMATMMYGVILLAIIFSGTDSTIVPAFITQTFLSAWVLMALYSEDLCKER